MNLENDIKRIKRIIKIVNYGIEYKIDAVDAVSLEKILKEIENKE